MTGLGRVDIRFCLCCCGFLSAVPVGQLAALVDLPCSDGILRASWLITASFNSLNTVLLRDCFAGPDRRLVYRPFSPLHSLRDVVWIQVEARPNLAAATDAARAYAPALRMLNGFALGTWLLESRLVPIVRDDPMLLRRYDWTE